MLENLKAIYISPLEIFLDEFNGSAKDLRGLFLVPKANINLFGQDFTDYMEYSERTILIETVQI